MRATDTLERLRRTGRHPAALPLAIVALLAAGMLAPLSMRQRFTAEGLFVALLLAGPALALLVETAARIREALRSLAGGPTAAHPDDLEDRALQEWAGNLSFGRTAAETLVLTLPLTACWWLGLGASELLGFGAWETILREHHGWGGRIWHDAVATGRIAQVLAWPVLLRAAVLWLAARALGRDAPGSAEALVRSGLAGLGMLGAGVAYVLGLAAAVEGVYRIPWPPRGHPTVIVVLMIYSLIYIGLMGAGLLAWRRHRDGRAPSA